MQHLSETCNTLSISTERNIQSCEFVRVDRHLRNNESKTTLSVGCDQLCSGIPKFVQNHKINLHV